MAVVPERDARRLWRRRGLDGEAARPCDESVVVGDGVDADVVERARVALVYHAALLRPGQTHLANLYAPNYTSSHSHTTRDRLHLGLMPDSHCLQFFDAVSWAAGRASGLYKN